MNENKGNSSYGDFYDLLDNPADLAQSNVFNLQQLINQFPQSGLLRSMLAVKRQEEALQSASAYVNPKLLYKISNALGSLRIVSAEQIVVSQIPGEAMPVLPLPVGVELPNLDIDESNYFHIPIDPDLVFIEDEKTEDVLPFEEDSESDDTHESEADESEAPVIEQREELDAEGREESETGADVLPSSESDSVVADGNETEATPSSEVDTEVTEEDETQVDAIPSPEVNGEVTGENETEADDTQPSAIDSEIADENNTDTAQQSEGDIEVAEQNEAQADTVPLSEIDSEIAEENEPEKADEPSPEIDNGVTEEGNTKVTEENDEEAQSNAAPLVIADEPDESKAALVDEIAPQSEETDKAGEEPESSAEPFTEETENPEAVEQEAEQAEEEADAAQPSVQVKEADADDDAIRTHQDEHPAEQTDNAAAENGEIDTRPAESGQEIDDEVFEEIVSIEDIGLEQLAIMDKAAVADEPEQKVADHLQKTEETVAGGSYFVFEPALPEDNENSAPPNVATRHEPVGKSHQNVSRYNDEKMPYSFMWWLDKTRKEHAAIYQPFATEGRFHTETVPAAEKPQPAADHLQQQYVENIFAVSSVVSDLMVIPPKTDAPPVETKTDKIIEKFIHEEPQIKHPSTVKLDSENKAKKSSEDRDELVTETLAKIYTEQMLYHKAILTYKKLMLKFPEKSLYFAGQIEQLENKIN